MAYRDVDGNIEEVTTAGRSVGDSLMLDSDLDPVWGEGSDTLAVRNESGSPMTKGQVVRIDGFNVGEDLPTVQLALADNETNSRAVAVLAENIADNANGTAVITGIVDGLDTAALGAGSPLYLDDGTAGDFVNTRPDNPAFTTFIGWVRRASGGTNGSILVKVEGNRRPVGFVFGFGGDADTGVVGDFFPAHGIFTDTMLTGLPSPPLGSQIVVPQHADGRILSLSWHTATANGTPPPPTQTVFVIWQNGVAVSTITVDLSGMAGTRPVTASSNSTC
jgi:hypothetical protein